MLANKVHQRNQQNMISKTWSLHRRGRALCEKKLLLCNAVVSEIAQTKEGISKKEVPPLHAILSWKVMKKYRLISSISRATGLCRHAMGKVQVVQWEKR